MLLYIVFEVKINTIKDHNMARLIYNLIRKGVFISVNVFEEKVQKLLVLAKEQARQRNDKGLTKAAEILLQLIDQGSNDPEVLIYAATYLLQGPKAADIEVKKKAIYLLDKATSLAPDDIFISEGAIHGYELVLNDFPEKLDNIIQLCLHVLDLDPNHIECMITLAHHREHPSVALSLADTIRMLEWAKEVEPDNVFVDLALARLYTENAQYGEAKKLYRSIIQNSGTGDKESKNAQHGINTLRSKSRTKKSRKYGVN